MTETRNQILEEIKSELISISIKEDTESDIKIHLNNINTLANLNDSANSLVSEISDIIYLLNREIVLTENKDEYLNSLIKSLEDKLMLNEDYFEIELNSIAENTYNELSEYSKMSKLEETENKVEIDGILMSHLSLFKTSITTLLDNIKYFINKYLEDNKSMNYLNIDEKKEVEYLFSALKSSMSSIYKMSSSSLLKNVDSISNKENKNEILKLFQSYQAALKTVLLASISLRILLGNISDKYSIESQVDSLYTNTKNNNLIDSIEKLSVSSIENDRNNSISIQVTNVNPIYKELINYILNTNENKMPSPSEVGDLFIKRMSLSSKYVHHIDQLICSANDINIATSDLMNKLTLKPLNDSIGGHEINLFSRLVASIKNELACLKSDIECATKTSSNYISNTFKSQIASNADVAHSIWDVYTRDRFHTNN